MSVQTKSVRNSLVYYDDRFPNTWLDAIGMNVTKWELLVGMPADDTSADPTRMVNTETGANTILSAAAVGERMAVTTGATEYNGVNLQTHVSAFQLLADKPVYFGISCKTANATKGDFLFGLCEVDTTLMAVSGAHAVTVTDDGVFFSHINDATAFIFTNEIGGVLDSTTIDVTHNVLFHRYEFYWDGTTLFAYFDGTLVTSIASSIADQLLTPSFNVRAGDDGAEVFNVEWARAIMID